MLLNGFLRRRTGAFGERIMNLSQTTSTKHYRIVSLFTALFLAAAGSASAQSGNRAPVDLKGYGLQQYSNANNGLRFSRSQPENVRQRVAQSLSFTITVASSTRTTVQSHPLSVSADLNEAKVEQPKQGDPAESDRKARTTQKVNPSPISNCPQPACGSCGR